MIDFDDFCATVVTGEGGKECWQDVDTIHVGPMHMYRSSGRHGHVQTLDDDAFCR